MAFHHQAYQAFALLIGFGEELLGRGEDGFLVRLYLDLGDGLDRDGDALLGVEILLRGDVERHELERKALAVFDHREDDRAVSLNHAGSAKAVNNQRFIWPRFAV